MSSQPTRFGSLSTGRITNGLVSIAAAGSLFLTGYLYTDRAQAPTVEQKYGSGTYAFYDDAIFSRSGSTNYWTARIQNTGTSGIPLDKITVECADTGINKTIPTDVGIRTSAQLNSSGSDVMNSRTSFTGSTIKHSTGSFVIPASGALRATTASGSYPGATRCQLRAWGHRRYIP